LQKKKKIPGPGACILAGTRCKSALRRSERLRRAPLAACGPKCGPGPESPGNPGQLADYRDVRHA